MQSSARPAADRTPRQRARKPCGAGALDRSWLVTVIEGLAHPLASREALTYRAGMRIATCGSLKDPALCGTHNALALQTLQEIPVPAGHPRSHLWHGPGARARAGVLRRFCPAGHDR